MRSKFWAMIGAILLTVALSSCATSRGARGPVTTPVPTKTLRPTFTYTPAKPTMTSEPTAVPATATPAAPTATPEPPTAAPSPTSEVSRLTANASVNVRSGPGTNYPQIGRLQAGQSFVITGKNPAGDWWQFDFNGRSGWVVADLVRASGGERVEVAANIAPPPTAAPRPTARPQPAQPKPQPTQPPAAAKQFAQGGVELRNAENTNFSVVTFWGRLGKPPGAPPGGFRLRVTTPSGTKEVPFDTIWQYAYTGLPSQFLYNAKAELPRTGGPFRAVVIDGGGNEVSDAISDTLLDRTHDVILFYAGR